jgi:hypothetical protein
MAKTPHGKLRDEITAYLTSIGAWWYSTNSQGYGRKGIPDIIGVFAGFGFGVEVKVFPDTPTPWQKRELAAIEKAQGGAFVVYDLEEFKNAFAATLHVYRIKYSSPPHV